MKQILTALLLTCTGLPLAHAASPPPGEKWKVTSNMQMAGMSMPGSTTELCKQPGDDTVPVKTDDNCEVYDVERSGNVQSFKMRCTGKNAVEGSAQFTYLSKDHYTGRMQMKAEGETMSMSYEGQKLGACDGTESNLKAKEMLALAEKQKVASEKQQKEHCHEIAAQGNSPYMMKTQCTDPADRKVFCGAVQTHENFQQLARAEKHTSGTEKPLSDSAALCGLSADAMRTKLCGSAESQGKLDFIASQCPAEAQALAKAQCAGRKYTAISDKYRGFCSSYANASSDDAPADNTPAGKAKSLLDKSKKSLGGLFGR